MSAKKTGGHGASLKAKNQAMAAQMKAQGITRNVAKCPVCNRLVALDRMYNHIIGCR